MSAERWIPHRAPAGAALAALVIGAIVTVAGVAAEFGTGTPGRSIVSPADGPPVQPAGTSGPTLSIAGATPSALGLSWTATNDLTFSKYEVQQSTSASSGPWSTVGTLSSQSDTTFYASGLTPASTSWWQVVEVDALGISAASNAVQQVQPGTATLTAASVSSSSVQLTWVNHASYGGSVQFQSYTVWQSVSGGSATSIGTITTEGTTSAEPAGLTSGTTYTFQVETTDACDKAANCGTTTPAASTYSNAAGATPPAASPADYAATFTETGLPSGTSWSATLNGSSQSATGSSIAFSEPNGSYSFTIGTVSGYAANPTSGSLTVAGAPTSQAVTFRSAVHGTYSVTFSESGLATATSWSVTLGSSTESSTGTSVVFSQGNGSSTFSVGVPSGYAATPASGTVTVAGGPVTTNVSFSYASGPGGTSISHVVLILLENEEVTNVWGGGPYERYLASAYGNATEFFATCHDSSADYFAVTSGRTFGCANAYPNPGFSVTEIGDLFEEHNLTWTAYEESMPSACDVSSSGYYINYHDPFVYYRDLNQNHTRCDAHVVSASSFNQSVETGDLPAFSFYTPNWEHDGHGPANSPWSASTGLTYIEAWLRGFLPPILNHTGAFNTAAERTLVNHTAFILLYDEGTTDLGYTVGSVYSTGCYNQTGRYVTACGGHVQLTVISPYSAHRQYTADATTYSVQSTIEWLFGLPSDGGLDGTSNFPAMTSLFSFTSNGYSLTHARRESPSIPTPGIGPSTGTSSSALAVPELAALLLLGGGIGASAGALRLLPKVSRRLRWRDRRPPPARDRTRGP